MSAELVHVADAVPSDEDGVYDLLLKMHEDQGAMFSIDEQKIRKLLHRMILRNSALCGVTRVDGVPVGAIGLIIDSYWWTSDPCLCELFNFVHPDHRRSNYAANQIDYAKRTSDALSDLRIPLAIGVFDAGRDGEGSKRTEAKLRFYRRALDPAGAIFTHNMDLVRQGARKDFA